MADPIIRDDPDRHRYEIVVDDVLAGFAVYHVRSGRYFFVHTEIDDAYEGRGLGSALARGALDDVRAKGATIVALCPFIAGWIDKHPDYADLVDEELTTSLGVRDR
jgi:predicted GNAT family acetyltransferase